MLDHTKPYVEKIHYIDQGFPTWGTCTPRGTFAYPKGYIEVINRRSNYICI